MGFLSLMLTEPSSRRCGQAGVKEGGKAAGPSGPDPSWGLTPTRAWRTEREVGEEVAYD